MKKESTHSYLTRNALAAPHLDRHLRITSKIQERLVNLSNIYKPLYKNSTNPETPLNQEKGRAQGYLAQTWWLTSYPGHDVVPS